MAEASRILIVDDEEHIRRFLTISLRAAHYQPLQAANGTSAIETCTQQRPDLILLDLGLPDMSGHEVIRVIRADNNVPIIVLSVRGEDEDKVKALDLGANDYVQKPFSTAELLARIRACLRVNAMLPNAATIEIGSLRIDTAMHVVQLDGRAVHLSKKEFELLLALARAAGRVCTHRQLLETVWGPTHREDVQYLRVYVAQLRNKLGDDPTAPRLISNEQGVGYRLCVVT